ncbi:MAG: hypothetical protein KDK08_07240 [Rhizobiaceae bacterium]|nr:hypothetical protein [Rhizobiaceae bacterium]
MLTKANGIAELRGALLARPQQRLLPPPNFIEFEGLEVVAAEVAALVLSGGPMRHERGLQFGFGRHFVFQGRFLRWMPLALRLVFAEMGLAQMVLYGACTPRL